MAYRKMMPPSKVDQRCAAMVGAVFWAWLTWNFITEFGHISVSFTTSISSILAMNAILFGKLCILGC